MADIIQLLPDHVANQIAAGEVIQRPASVVKELLENAVDAGAKNIQLVIKEAGRKLVQVIDNGCGMSETDARMCFERHATSKIRKAEDLFEIRSMGFRGEAMASIAAVAQVELRARLHDKELGTCLKIEGSKVLSQEPCQCAAGTNISVKNLFFNIPARRNFLKSNPVEMRHVLEEFQRVAIPFHQISFSLIHNDQENYRLPAASLKQRIVALMGNHLNEKLLPVNEQTNIVNITGFVGKPDSARKTRGEQYFFINKRFFKSSYLHHAVQSAMQNLIAQDAHPPYFIFFDIDPSFIDINIHPTKTEIKFTDEKSIYAILRSAIKKAIGQHILSPVIDFEGESTLSIPIPKKPEDVNIPMIQVDPNFNPFESKLKSKRFYGNDSLNQWPKSDWETITGEVIPEAQLNFNPVESQPVLLPERDNEERMQSSLVPFLLHKRYLITQVKSGMMLIDVKGALFRIVFERLMKAQKTSGNAQQLLFPYVKECSGPDFELLLALREELHQLGFSMEQFGERTVVFNGMPGELNDASPELVVDELLQNFKSSMQQLYISKLETLAISVAENIARYQWRTFKNEEGQQLIDRLFACEIPGFDPKGASNIQIISLDELSEMFAKH
ncbi:MAG: DNA mismatch repair endonuclease MutL [Flavobacteriales bacterium]